MNNAITDGPNTDYSFGYNFNYGVWLAGTVVTLCNVNWNNDYRDIVQFPLADGTTLDEYINGLETPIVTIDNMMYIRPNMPVKLNLPINHVYMFNYLRVSNPVQPVPGGDVVKPFYYFILDAKQVAPNMTEVIVQLDVWQTFGKEVTFGNCYIDRGHIGIANENNFDNNGRDYLTVPEGLDYGGEYRIIHRVTETILGLEEGSFDVIIASTTDLTVDPGDVDNPTLVTAQGSTFENLVSGATYYVIQANFYQFMYNIQQYPWVSAGIISITIVPKLTRYMPGFVYIPNTTASSLFTDGVDNFIPGAKITKVFPNWRADSSFLSAIPTAYQKLKKFLTSPYMIIEMTTWSATPIVLKPESWTDEDASIVENATFTPPNQRIAIRPLSYNSQPGATIDNWGHYDTAHSKPNNIGAGDDGGDYLDLATIISGFPTMAIVNNGAMGYLASQFANIAYNKQAAMWAQQRALSGAETSFGQNQNAIIASASANAVGNEAATANTALANQNAINNQAIQGSAGILMGMGGLISADPSASGLANGIGNEIVGSMVVGNSAQTSASQTANTVNSSKSQNAIANRQSAYNNDTNLGYAQYAAKGDYANAIAGVNAQIQSASMVQPTTSGQQGGDTFNLVNESFEVSLRWKLIDNASLRTIGNYWLRYGYAVNQFSQLPSNLLCMTKFAYWKLRETYIISSTVPEMYKQAIRGIFENGVTVWADPAFIGNTALADNEIVSGYTL